MTNFEVNKKHFALRIANLKALKNVECVKQRINHTHTNNGRQNKDTLYAQTQHKGIYLYHWILMRFINN